MAKAIFKVLLKFIKSIVEIVLTPINLAISALFPDFSSMISTFNSAVSTYVGRTLAWFSHILPPGVRGLIVFYLTFLIAYYSVTVTVHAVIKVIHIIKAIKIW